ncbi:MAG: Gfo/Idh/MocA family oxidoreductase [Thermoproteales archaeon]|nr:Gfo/Idh/MocA family oxidoreductase [Thermoproteales archaeon]
MRKLKYAVIGVGGVGKSHLNAAMDLEEYEIVAVADVNEEFGKMAAEQYKAKWYKDYNKMLEKEELDVVSICTPHFLHSKMSIDTLNAGVNVLVEKPMAIRVSEADEMINVAKKNSVTLGVVFQHRFDPEVQYSRNMVANEELGELYYTSLFYGCYRTQPYYRTASWRGTWKYEGGGVLINQAIHYIDSFQWIIGVRPRRLVSLIDTLLHEIEVEDVASVSIEYENGVKGFIYISSYYYPGKEAIEIQGNKGILKIENGNINVITYSPSLRDSIFDFSDGKWGRPPETSKKEIILEEPRFKGHKAVLYDFARAIIEEREPMVSGEEGRKSVEIVNAIIMSGVTGRFVSFPIDVQEYDNVYNKLVEARKIIREGV